MLVFANEDFGTDPTTAFLTLPNDAHSWSKASLDAEVLPHPDNCFIELILSVADMGDVMFFDD